MLTTRNPKMKMKIDPEPMKKCKHSYAGRTHQRVKLNYPGVISDFSVGSL